MAGNKMSENYSVKEAEGSWRRREQGREEKKMEEKRQKEGKIREIQKEREMETRTRKLTHSGKGSTKRFTTSRTKWSSIFLSISTLITRGYPI